MRRTCTCKWQGEYMHMQMTGRMKSTSYRMVIWWKWRDIHDENLHFVDKVSLEVRLNLNELSLRLRLHRITANVEVKLNFCLTTLAEKTCCISTSSQIHLGISASLLQPKHNNDIWATLEAGAMERKHKKTSHFWEALLTNLRAQSIS